MVDKTGYDESVTDNQSLHRIFSSSDAGKYPTIGKIFQFQPNTDQPSQDSTTNAAQSISAPQQTNDDDQNLDLLDNLVSQAILSHDQQTVSQTAPQTGSRAKELLPNEAQTVESNQIAEQTTEAAIEAPRETVVSPEVSELSKELKEVTKEVKEQREQAEIKDQQQEINNLANAATTPVAVSDKPVVVLPITEKSKEEAKFKSTKYSVRWLWEWCKKVAKMFSGAVIYKEEIDNE